MGIRSKLEKLNQIRQMPKGFLSTAIMRINYFYKNSSASSNKKDVKQLCREMRIVSHTIEKGMSLPNVHKGFGKEKIKHLLELLDTYIEINNFEYDYEAFLNTLGTIKMYVNESEKYGCDISYINLGKYSKWIDETNVDDFGVTSLKSVNKKVDLQKIGFYDFAYNRHSVRGFQNKELPIEVLKDAIRLAQTAPSACNRQSVRVIHIKDKDLCKKILNIQGGAKGHDVSEILLVASDLSLYKHLSEIDTPYLDAGIFLMNLLYSCEYYGISTCPLIWDDYGSKGIKLRELLSISESIHIVAVVQIGICLENGVYAKSKRKKFDDIYISEENAKK